MALPAKDRARLVALLGMLGSEHDGERANAAKLAATFVRTRGLTWDALISTGAVAPQPRPQAYQHTYYYTPPDQREWFEKLAVCDEKKAKLTEWERNFVASLLLRQAYELTDKQIAVISRIFEKVTRA